MRDQPYLRARKSAAPLKLQRVEDHRRPRPHLRARKSAAPLKRLRPRRRPPPSPPPPRSKERGPVEARCRPLSAGGTFRPPRSKERGPVEAAYGPFPDTLEGAHLRARKSAAPLKLTFEGNSYNLMPDLRARKSAAPLKLLSSPIEPPRPRAPPRSKERGPVEARWPGTRWRISPTPTSALERARPR